MSAIGPTSVGPSLVAAIEASDVLWAGLVALLVWGIGWAVIAALGRREEGAPSEPAALERNLPQEPPPFRSDGEPQSVSGVLRWLLAETDAESVAFLRLSPGGHERFIVEPRGLEPPAVSSLARVGRDALVGEGGPLPRGVVATRWLGTGGTKALVLRGPGSTLAGTEEPLRFARFAIEWAGAPPETPPSATVEERVRAIPGIAWAELDGKGNIRLLTAEKVDHDFLEDAVSEALSGSGIRAKWVAPADRNAAEQRARLVAVEMDGGEQAAALVQLDWQGQELRGRGYGSQTPSGRFQAAAHAVADALGPLVSGDVRLEGVYIQTQAGQEVVVAVVSVDGQRLVGAVPVTAADPGTSGARAVLDAVNRKLSVIAGGSGQL